jgi:hypothetical protein
MVQPVGIIENDGPLADGEAAEIDPRQSRPGAARLILRRVVAEHEDVEFGHVDPLPDCAGGLQFLQELRDVSAGRVGPWTYGPGMEFFIGSVSEIVDLDVVNVGAAAVCLQRKVGGGVIGELPRYAVDDECQPHDPRASAMSMTERPFSTAASRFLDSGLSI